MMAWIDWGIMLRYTVKLAFTLCGCKKSIKNVLLKIFILPFKYILMIKQEKGMYMFMMFAIASCITSDFFTITVSPTP